MVYIPWPPSISIYRALPFSGFIQGHWSVSSLIYNPWITCHIPCSVGHLGSKQRASLHPIVIPSHRWNRPYLSTVRSRSEYSIPLSFSLLTFTQLDAPELTTAVDMIDPYLSAVRSGDTYQIPLGSIILTITQVYVPKFSTAVDPLRL